VSTVDSGEIARMARRRMDRHEITYEDGGSAVFDDSGLLRYGRALRAVLALCDVYEVVMRQDGYGVVVDYLRQAIGYELGLTQAPPPGVSRG